MYRSRLQTLEEKRDMRATVGIILATVGILVFIGILAVKSLPKLAGMLSNSKKEMVGKNDLIPPPPPSFNFDFSATNSAALSLSGNAEPESMIYLTQNGEPQGSKKATTDGRFIFDNLALKEGNNTFQSIASDQSGNQSRPSDTLTIMFSNKSPRLDIDSPADGSSVNSKKLTVRGTTDPNNKLILNERWIMVSSTGSFETSINLETGENTLTFEVTDQAGNQLKRELKVTLGN